MIECIFVHLRSLLAFLMYFGVSIKISGDDGVGTGVAPKIGVVAKRDMLLKDKKDLTFILTAHE